MKIVGCDLHAGQQSIAMMDSETGELSEKLLKHEGNAVREFYSSLEGPVVVGIEATGAMQWFLQLLEELGIECRVGHPAKIRAAETRQQKHDRRDAEVILELLLRKGKALWTATGRQALQDLALPDYTAQRRDELLRLYMQLEQRIQQLDKQVEKEALGRLQARRLLTHLGVGPVMVLVTEVFLGDPHRFDTANQVASYIGMIPCEHSSGKRRRLGKLTKEGNSLLRYLWTEATLHAAVKDPELKRFYRRKLVQKGMGKARVATARKLGIRLWIMLRDEIDYEEFCRRGKLPQKGKTHAGMPDFNSGPARAVTGSTE